jgi:putative membrane protein
MDVELFRVSNENKNNLALAIAVIFHIVGLVGILFINESFFVALTPMNLFLSVLLLIWTQPQKNISFLLFALVAFVTGFMTEYVGVNHQILFGNYQYGNTLGFKTGGVPWMIGLNWLMVICGAGIMTRTLFRFMTTNKEAISTNDMRKYSFWIQVGLGALLATLFDWLMEPVAVRLGYWSWMTAEIPFKNYRDWFLVSAFLLFFFFRFGFPKKNQFALHLLLIQTLFFLILRIVLI